MMIAHCYGVIALVVDARIARRNTESAFAASLGWGVAFSAIAVGIVQGLLTVLGALVGAVLAASAISAITATGGVLLIGVSLRLLKVSRIAVADLLPALIVAPLLTLAVAAWTGTA